MTSDELRTKRKSLGLSQSQMADALRVSLRTYQGWEHSKESSAVVETAISGDFDKRAAAHRKNGRGKKGSKS